MIALSGRRLNKPLFCTFCARAFTALAHELPYTATKGRQRREAVTMEVERMHQLYLFLASKAKNAFHPPLLGSMAGYFLQCRSPTWYTPFIALSTLPLPPSLHCLLNTSQPGWPLYDRLVAMFPSFISLSEASTIWLERRENTPCPVLSFDLFRQEERRSSLTNKLKFESKEEGVDWNNDEGGETTSEEKARERQSVGAGAGRMVCCQLAKKDDKAVEGLKEGDKDGVLGISIWQRCGGSAICLCPVGLSCSLWVLWKGEERDEISREMETVEQRDYELSCWLPSPVIESAINKDLAAQRIRSWSSEKCQQHWFLAFRTRRDWWGGRRTEVTRQGTLRAVKNRSWANAGNIEQV
jgi:hypothetical protein